MVVSVLGVEVPEEEVERRWDSRSNFWSARSFLRFVASVVSVSSVFLFLFWDNEVLVDFEAEVGGLEDMKAFISARSVSSSSRCGSWYSITSTSFSLSLMPDQSDSSSSSSSSFCTGGSSILSFLGSVGRGLNFASKARRNTAWRSSAPESSLEPDEGDGDRDSCSSSARVTRFRFPSAGAIILS